MTNAEARCNKSLRPRKPEGSLGRTAQDVHLDSHTAPELCATTRAESFLYIYIFLPPLTLAQAAPDLDLELDEVLAGVEGEEGDVLVADHGQHVALPLQGEARLQPQVAIQREGGLHLAPGPQRLVYVLVQDQLQSVCKHQMGHGEKPVLVEDNIYMCVCVCVGGRGGGGGRRGLYFIHMYICVCVCVRGAGAAWFVLH